MKALTRTLGHHRGDDMSTIEEARRLGALSPTEFAKQFLEFLDGLPSVDEYIYRCPNCPDKILLEEDWRVMWFCEFCHYETRTRPTSTLSTLGLPTIEEKDNE